MPPKNALACAKCDPSSIDCIIVATCTPDYGGTPSTACMVQKYLGGTPKPAFDLNAACTGFVYALQVASSLVQTVYHKILVIGSETLSMFIDWANPKVAPLLGDGAGAVVLSRYSGIPKYGIIDFVLSSKGDNEALVVPAGGSIYPTTDTTVTMQMHFLKMNGRAVFKFAIEVSCKSIRDLCERNRISLSDVRWIFLHQANLRISQAIAANLGVSEKKFHHTIQRFGNTSSASIPLGLDDAYRQGLLKPGDTIILAGFGGGLTWGACLLQWAI